MFERLNYNNKTMGTYRSICLLLVCIAIGFNSVHGTYGSDTIKCPLRCQCEKSTNSTGWSVVCDDKTTWNKMPLLPRNTIYLSIYNSYIPVLQNGAKGNRGCKTLQTLLLIKDNIAKIDPKYFQGMSQLKELELSKNKLQPLANGTLSGLVNLQTITLNHDEFETLPAENICLLKELRRLEIAWNKMTRINFGNCFMDLKHLQSLDLSGNPIDQIQPGDLDGLRNSPLSTLNLWQLKLYQLSTNVFKYLGHLKVLMLKGNRIKHLEPNLFKYTPELTSLNLQENRLNSIPYNALANLVNLETLILARTNFKTNRLGAAFRKFVNLTQLDLSHNPMVSLNKQSFFNLKPLTKLTELKLIDCKLRTIAAGTFLPLRYLKILWLSENGLLTASALETAFYGVQFTLGLNELYLDRTNLQDLNNNTFRYLANTAVSFIQIGDAQHFQNVPSGAFNNLPNLNVVALKGSGIQSFQPDAFSPENIITELDLMKNHLPYVPRGSSLHFANLRSLKLATNAIMKLFPSTFEGYGSLTELNLQNNGITTLDDNVFTGIPDLKTLLLTSNKIKRITKNAFVGLEKLEMLEMARNDIIEINAEVFCATPNLLFLSLKGNIHYGSEKVGNDIATLLKPLKKLSTVILNSMSLLDLPFDVFYNLTELQIINLGNNLLSKLDDLTFKDQSKLTVLSVRKNKLLTINKTILDPLVPHLEKLDVSENIFQCECNIRWFTDWIRTAVVYMPHLDAVTCKSPPDRRGIQLENLYLDKECMLYTIYYVYWIALLLYVTIITAVTMIYRLRWYIKYWLHLVRARKAMERETGEERYVFDAFVSYAHQDMKWVVRELLPRLEYEANIRLCLHQRNWLGGRSIARNIIDSIERSRKTVLVLSNHYARSKWGELEMSLAQHKLLTTRRETTVPILLEDINKKYVTEQMVCLFASQTYITYPRGNENEQRRFWSKLVKTLRPPQDHAEYDEDPNVFLTDINAIRPAARN